MSNTIKAPQLGPELDRTLKAINDAETTENNDMVLYIRHGEFAFAPYDDLFTFSTPTPEVST